MAKRSKKKRLDSQGDLGTVYEEYRSELQSFVMRHVYSLEEAEDIIQDVFYNLTRADLVNNPIEYLSSWLYRAANNRIIDRYRKKKEKSLPETVSADDDEYFIGALSDFLADDDDDPDIMFRNMIIREEIERALSELPHEQRTVFMLTEYDGISYKEISKQTGIPVATLLSRKHYAVAHLRQKLRALYDEINGS